MENIIQTHENVIEYFGIGNNFIAKDCSTYDTKTEQRLAPIGIIKVTDEIFRSVEQV